MAIGAARVLGFQFPENFQMPFGSFSITEFWRRWHITLSTWFRDYLFLPLEIATRGAPIPLLRMSVNMTITMLLCGLWHGPSWNYVVWGGVHGAALAVHKIWTTRKPAAPWMNSAAARFIGRALALFLTLGVIVLANVFFRTQSLHDAMTYFARMFSLAHGTRLLSIFIIPGIAAVALAHLLLGKDRDIVQELPQMSVAARILAYSSLLTALVCFAATESAPFIYFKY